MFERGFDLWLGGPHAGLAWFLHERRALTMTPEQLAALLPILGVWMTAGLATGWLVGLLSQAAGGRR